MGKIARRKAAAAGSEGKAVLETPKRIPLTVKIYAGAAAVMLFLAVWLAFGQRTVLAVPRTMIEAGTEAMKKSGNAVFELIPYDGTIPPQSIIIRADFVICRLDANAVSLQAEGLIVPIRVEAETMKLFPPVLISGLRALFPKTEGGALPVLPVTVDPAIMLWRTDWTGGVDGSAPVFFDELVGKGGTPLTSPLFSLAGLERETLLRWFGYLQTRNLRDTESLASRESAIQALADFSALAESGWFQKAGFSYGWDDALVLVKQGKLKGSLVPLSRYYALPMAERPEFKVGTLPLSRSATKAATIADLWVACRTRRQGNLLGQDAAIRLLCDPGFQSGLAHAEGTLPAAASGPFRDLSSRTAGERLLSSSVLIVPALLDSPLADGTKPSEAMAAELRKAAMTQK